MVFNELDKILILFNKQKEHYAVDRLPLSIVNNIIDLVKLKDSNDVKEFDNFKENFNKTLEVLKLELKKQSSVIGDGNISYSETEIFIDEIKESFKEGQKLQV